MPLKAESKRLSEDMARIANDRTEMAVGATVANSRIREETDAAIERSRKLLKDTAHLLKDDLLIKR